MQFPSLGWVDWVLVAVLVLSVLVGLMRGVVFELMSLAGWVIAWFAAQWFAPEIARWVPVGTPGSALNHAAAFVLGFVGALVIWAILARLVRLLLHATPLSIPDRLLGAGFGVVRATVLLLAVATVVALTPAAQSAAWRQSVGAKGLDALMQGLKPVLPQQLQGWLPR